MWRTDDGRLHVSQATDFSEAKRAAEGWSLLQRRALARLLRVVEEAVRERAGDQFVDSDVEREYASLAVPRSALSGVAWNDFLAQPCGDVVERVDLRWRLDVVVGLRGLLIELDEEAGEAAERADVIQTAEGASAAADYLRTVQRRLDHAGLWRNLGLLYEEMGEDNLAVVSFTAAIDAGSWQAYVDRGFVNDRNMRNVQAEHDYRDALSYDDRNVAALVNLGTLRLEMGDAREAGELLAVAAELDPSANWQLSDVRLAEINPEGARDAALAAVAAGETRAYLELAKAYAMLGMPADKTFQRAILAGAAGASEEYERYRGHDGPIAH